MNSEEALKLKRLSRRARVAGLVACAALVAIPSSSAMAGGGGVSSGGGGGSKTTPGSKAKLKRNGKAIPPANAPKRVKRAIEAANRIDKYPYQWGGGHRGKGYDCSGAVSYVLGKKGARLLDAPMTSGGFASWGDKGKGNWITTYGDSDHVFVEIAGLRFDTSMPDDGKSGPGWSKNVKQGFANVSKNAARHKGSY